MVNFVVLLALLYHFQYINGKTVSIFYDQEITSDACYNRYGRPHRCLPNFENIAYGKKIEASHTCGETKPTKYCQWSRNSPKCKICDASKPELAHPVSYLTDLNNPSDITCWQTDPIGNEVENITLTLSFGKQFDVTYINLEFCSYRPDAMVIYKSNDFGKTWTPYQYYADHCMGTFQKSNRGIVSHRNEVEALCTNAHLLRPLRGGRIAFVTLEGRPSAPNIDYNEILQEWVTATDIKVVFKKISHTPRQLNRKMMYYGISDFSVGGRCQCNGHASRCMKNKQGQLVCDCKHNTYGANCEKCLPFYQDRPWMRATAESANECKICNCSNHAKQCRFKPEVFKVSRGRSGGECINCRHNTAGRYCHYCKEGYYRDKGKDISHRKACIKCDCHPVGSRGKICDQATGQCPCKEGVTGRTCNECKNGYKKTKAMAAPCVNVKRSHQPPKKTRNADCKQCRPSRLQLKKYCKRDFAILLTVTSRKHIKEWVKFTTEIEEVFKWTGDSHFRKGPQELWVRYRDVRCRCPRLHRNRSYLVVGVNDVNGINNGVFVNPKTAVLRWNKATQKKILKYKKRQRRGACQ